MSNKRTKQGKKSLVQQATKAVIDSSASAKAAYNLLDKTIGVEKAKEYLSSWHADGGIFGKKARAYREAQKSKVRPPRAGVTSSFAPAAVSSGIRNAYVRNSRTAPQKNTDLSGNGMNVDALRVEFRDMIPLTVAVDDTTNWEFRPFRSNGSGNYTGGWAVTPLDMSNRLSMLEEMYGYYAFRELDITYIPSTATATSGALAIAVDMSVDRLTTVSLAAGVGYTQTMQHAIAGSTSVYGGMTLKYRFSGSKLWQNTTVLSGPVTPVLSDYVQATIWGCLANVAANNEFGMLQVSGVIDFYKANEPNTTSPARREEELWKRYAFRQYLDFLTVLNHEDICFDEFLRRYLSALKERERKKIIEVKDAPLVLYSPYESKGVLHEHKQK